jgi:hypothetical protein
MRARIARQPASNAATMCATRRSPCHSHSRAVTLTHDVAAGAPRLAGDAKACATARSRDGVSKSAQGAKPRRHNTCMQLQARHLPPCLPGVCGWGGLRGSAGGWPAPRTASWHTLLGTRCDNAVGVAL